MKKELENYFGCQIETEEYRGFIRIARIYGGKEN